MASSGSSPPSSGDRKHHRPEMDQPTHVDGHTIADKRKEISEKSVFVYSEPLQEDQVQNAVKFLSHPNVRCSPVIHRRNFLERKGLNKEEIDEAFCRVPDPSSSNSGQSTSVGQDGQAKRSSAVQQNSAQNIQPVASPFYGIVSISQRPFNWSRTLVTIGFLAVSGAGTLVTYKKVIVPQFKSWIHCIISNSNNGDPKSFAWKPSLEGQIAMAAKAAAAAAADAARTSQEMVLVQQEGSKQLEEFMTLFNAHIQEMNSLRVSIKNIEVEKYNRGRTIHTEEECLNDSISRAKQPSSTSGAEFDSLTVRSISPLRSADPPHPKSYMEIMTMIQRGERPPNIKDIDDSPPNPEQPISNPSLARRAKPWEPVQDTNSPNYSSQSLFIDGGSSSKIRDGVFNYQLNNNEALAPWWQQKNRRNPEIKSGDDSTGANPVDQPLKRQWVPPQPSPEAMPEIAFGDSTPKFS